MAHICLVTHVVTPWDGQGRVMYELARYLIRQGHEVTLVASEVESTLRDAARITWIRIPVPSRVPALVRWTIFAAMARFRLRRAVVANFDIIHLNGAIVPVRADVNTSHFVHAAWRRITQNIPALRRRLGYHRLVTAISAICERRAYASVDRVVAVSDGVRDALMSDVGTGDDRVRVIYNGVDTDEFRPRLAADAGRLRESLGLPADAFVVLFVGDAKSPRKNLDLALQTMTKVGSRFRLVVVGESRGGPYPALAERLAVSARTHFMGPRRDVAACLRDADAVFCASQYEPASLVLLEALASAVPVISSRSVGNATFIEHGQNGFLVRSSTDVEGAASILESLGADPALGVRVGQAARDTALRLSWTRMGQQYEELYRELMAEPHRVRAKNPKLALRNVPLEAAGGDA